MIELPPLSWILFHSVAHDLPCWRLRSKKSSALQLRSVTAVSWIPSPWARPQLWKVTSRPPHAVSMQWLCRCSCHRIDRGPWHWRSPSVPCRPPFHCHFDILMLASATVATCYAFCTNNHFTTVWHTHACKRHSCDMLRFLHQQSLYNSLTYSCLQAPQLRHDRPSAPTIALQQFDILMLASATVATW